MVKAQVLSHIEKISSNLCFIQISPYRSPFHFAPLEVGSKGFQNIATLD